MKPRKPNQIMTIDFETYYDKEYSLSKMSTLDYIMDMFFQPICLAVKVDDKPVEAVQGDGSSAPGRMAEMLQDLGWDRSLVIGHNNRFDASICRFRLDLPAPAMYGCTRLMARAAVVPWTGTATLRATADHFKRGAKGEQRETYIGYRLEDFTPTQLADYMGYCRNDAHLTYAVFKDMNKHIPSDEMINMDLVLRMYLHPLFELDATVLQRYYKDVLQRKQELLDNLPAGFAKEDLTRPARLQKLLPLLGAEVPMKWSDKQQKMIPALAKTDEGFQELLENGSEEVQAVCAARMGFSSTIAETRAKRLLDIAQRYRVLNVPLIWGAAHTLRYGGDEKINLQNLMRNPDDLRRSVKAPKGYSVVAADYAQIEARVCAALAGCDSLLQAFADSSRDPYAEFASDAFIRRVTKKEHPAERFAGKVCILQLQYGSGWPKLQKTLARGEGGRGGVQLPDGSCQRLVKTYRQRYWEIPRLWNICEQAFRRMAAKESFDLMPGIDVRFGMVYLPNGLVMPYRELECDKHGQGWSYMHGKTRRHIYGAKMVENLVQAVAGIILRQAMDRLWLKHGIRTRHQVHDELIFCLPDSELDAIIPIIREEMLQPVPYLPNLPLEVEIGVGPNYAEAK